MATEQDIAEVLTYFAILEAGGEVKLFDQPHENLYYEPDLLATIDAVPILILVNGSDSFFASQKKVWRNVEEPFQAKSKNVVKIVVSISFISTVAKNALFDVCSKFFDSQYILCDQRKDWRRVRDELYEFARTQGGVPKRQLIEKIESGCVPLPCLLKGLLVEVAAYLKASITSTFREEEAFEVDRERYQSLERRSDVILQSGASSDRRSFVMLSLISMIRGVSLSPGDVLARVAGNVKIRGTEVEDQDCLLSAAIGLQESVGVGYSAIPTGFSIGPLPSGASAYLRIINPDLLLAIRDRMFSCSPILEDLFGICTNYSLVTGLVREWLASSETKKLLARKLFECGQDCSEYSDRVRRNYVLDLLLQLSGRSQTYVQQRCGIGRLTHVATKELSISLSQASDIVDVVYRDINREIAVDAIAKKYIADRYYSICTHSYCSPLYFQLLDALLEIYPAERIRGFPEKNSEVVRCWHNDYSGGAGAIKVQFVIEDLAGDASVIIRVCSAHEGHSADKRKEIAAKARLLSISENGNGNKCRSKMKKILVLDGDWRGPQSDPDRHLRMMYEAGWDLILGPEHIDMVGTKIKEWNAKKKSQ